jgi:hypothetical protein
MLYILQITALAEMYYYLEALKHDTKRGLLLMTPDVCQALNYFWNEFTCAVATRTKAGVYHRVEVLLDDMIYS